MRYSIRTMLLIVLIVGVFLAVARYYGRVTSSELNLRTLEVRTATYTSIPILDIPLSPTTYTNCNKEIPSLLKELGLRSVSDSDVAEDHWEFIRGRRAGIRGWRGEFSIVYNKLYGGENEAALIAWSLKHPEEAKMRWAMLFDSLSKRDTEAATLQMMDFQCDARVEFESDRPSDK